MTTRSTLAAATALALALGGCTLGPDFEPPNWISPVSWFAGRPTPGKTPKPLPSLVVAEPIDPNWWNLFADPELTSLEGRVAASNLDVQAATIRLAESRAQRGITGANQFPTFNGNASYTRERASKKGIFGLFGGAGASSGTSANGAGQGGVASGASSATGPSAASGSLGAAPFDIWQYGFDASWELDLWGKVRRSIEDADATIQQSQDARRDSLLSSLAEVASDYMQLRGAQAQLKIAQDNLKTAQQSLQLTQERAAGGLTTDLDVANASAQVQTTAAQIPQLEQQIAQYINAIGFLLGQQPNALRAELETPKPVPPVPPRVPVGMPGELVRRRPDIREAEANLHSATAEIGVAEADFLPSVTLNGSLGIQALNFKDLATWDARQYALGPSITIPIFEGGKLRGNLELRRAQQQAAAIAYQRAVLNAWNEVDNDLTAYQAEQRRRDALVRAVQANRRAVGLAQDRYRQGIADFLAVLDAERSLLASEEQLAQSTATVSNNLVSLYKALGGGWEAAFPETTGLTQAKL